jgi:hypothetical protein
VLAEAGHNSARQPRADQSAGTGGSEGQAVLPGREPELAQQQHSQERFGRHDQPADEQVVEIERPQVPVAQDVQDGAPA